jgi:DNA-binding CsgD family transcriptional regulator
MEYELEIKSKQLSSHALHMMQKNKMLQEVKTQMEELIDQSKMENKPDLRKINRMLDRNIKTEREWKLFKIYFEELNSGFFNKLKLINPVLTQNELKLCALTKLGFNLKETSSLLNVSINTIKNARYKLKIKLGIEKDASLKEYIDAML